MRRSYPRLKRRSLGEEQDLGSHRRLASQSRFHTKNLMSLPTVVIGINNITDPPKTYLLEKENGTYTRRQLVDGEMPQNVRACCCVRDPVTWT